MSKFEQLIDTSTAYSPARVPDNAQITRRVPVGSLRNALVMLVLSLSSGAVVFFAVGAMAIGFEWNIVVPLIAFGLATLTVWLYLLLFQMPALLSMFWAVETITGKDITGDKVIGPPPPAYFVIEDVEQLPGATQHRMFDLEGEPEKFAKFAFAMVTDGSLSEAAWTGKGRPYSKAQFSANRDNLIQREWLRWINPQHRASGIEVTPKGKRRAAQWLEQYAGTRTHATGGLIDLPPQGVGEGG